MLLSPRQDYLAAICTKTRRLPLCCAGSVPLAPSFRGDYIARGALPELPSSYLALHYGLSLGPFS
jgi:hypothetical protein